MTHNISSASQTTSLDCSYCPALPQDTTFHQLPNQHHQTVLTALLCPKAHNISSASQSTSPDCSYCPALTHDTQHFLSFPNNITRLFLLPCSAPRHTTFPQLPKQHYQTVLNALLFPMTLNISSASQSTSPDCSYCPALPHDTHISSASQTTSPDCSYYPALAHPKFPQLPNQHHQTVLTALLCLTQHFLSFPNNITKLFILPCSALLQGTQHFLSFPNNITRLFLMPCSAPRHPAFPQLPKQAAADPTRESI